MITSPPGLVFLEHQEVLRLEAYLDSSGNWTCGFGHTMDVDHATTCSTEQAYAWLKADVADVEHYVNTQFSYLIQCEFDALVSFVFNIGETNLRNSTTLRLLKNGALFAAAERFPLWDKSRDKRTGQLVEVEGLRERRLREQNLFRNGVYGYGQPNASYVR